MAFCQDIMISKHIPMRELKAANFVNAANLQLLNSSSVLPLGGAHVDRAHHARRAEKRSPDRLGGALDVAASFWSAFARLSLAATAVLIIHRGQKRFSGQDPENFVYRTRLDPLQRRLTTQPG